jgi:hypothetical protein
MKRIPPLSDEYKSAATPYNHYKSNPILDNNSNNINSSTTHPNDHDNTSNSTANHNNSNTHESDFTPPFLKKHGAAYNNHKSVDSLDTSTKKTSSSAIVAAPVRKSSMKKHAPSGATHADSSGTLPMAPISRKSTIKSKKVEFTADNTNYILSPDAGAHIEPEDSTTAPASMAIGMDDGGLSLGGFGNGNSNEASPNADSHSERESSSLGTGSLSRQESEGSSSTDKPDKPLSFSPFMIPPSSVSLQPQQQGGRRMSISFKTAEEESDGGVRGDPEGPYLAPLAPLGLSNNIRSSILSLNVPTEMDGTVARRRTTTTYSIPLKHGKYVVQVPVSKKLYENMNFTGKEKDGEEFTHTR